MALRYRRGERSEPRGAQAPTRAPKGRCAHRAQPCAGEGGSPNQRSATTATWQAANILTRHGSAVRLPSRTERDRNSAAWSFTPDDREIGRASVASECLEEVITRLCSLFASP